MLPHAILAMLLFLPVAASAQSADLIASLRAQIAVIEERMRTLAAGSESAAESTAFSCPILQRTLNRGMRGDDVRQLQDFLKAEGVFTEESTGFFGALTEASVKEWQVRRGVIRPAEDTGGWGVVGPRTRIAIVDRCGEIARAAAVVSATTTETQLPDQTPSATTTATTSVACSTPSCSVQPNRAPSIFGIDGPEEIEVGVTGRYAVIAQDPDNDRLEYEIDWGGGTTPLDALYALAGLQSSSSGSTFTHSFPSAGLYTLTATVRDPKGQTARATLGVRVKALSTTCHSCATSTPIYEEELPVDVIQIPSGITSCATPWGGVILQTGRTVPATPYFRGSVTYTGEIPQMRCAQGRWEKCDASGANCVVHATPRTNATMQSLRRYADVVGAGGCGGLGAGTTALAEPRTLLCANIIHQAPQGRCAYTQENTAVELFCSYNNWAERLTLQ